MELLLLSNSTMVGEPFLSYPKPYILDFFGLKPINALFIPYAGVTLSWDDYEQKVKKRFNEWGHDCCSIHRFDDPVKAVMQAEIIVVGGGNTWNLVHYIHKFNLTEPIRSKVLSGTKYLGWSAGSNLACPTLKTTNDMPIIDPMGFEALNLVPFQINPHYLDKNPEGHGGETRQDRIMEFLEANTTVAVVGLREGCLLKQTNNRLELFGSHSMRIFQNGIEPREVQVGEDISFLLNCKI